MNDQPPRFLLGTHQPGWLSHVGVPMFVSDRRLRSYRTLPMAVAPWGLDSGGFTELQQFGEWSVSPAQYVARVRRYRDTIGNLLWAAPQDWMCEPIVIAGGRVGPVVFAGTGLSVLEHQRRTVANFVQLRSLAPDLPFIPVVQGWTTHDYLHCVDLYESAGIDLTVAELVGVGSVCRRQNTKEAGHLLRALHRRGLTSLHGFGFKTLGLRQHGHLLASADSMAWSIAARHRPPLPGCTRHKSCANCPRYALRWRADLLTALTTTQPGLHQQLPLFHELETAS